MQSKKYMHIYIRIYTHTYTFAYDNEHWQQINDNRLTLHCSEQPQSIFHFQFQQRKLQQHTSSPLIQARSSHAGVAMRRDTLAAKQSVR